jgi:uncharacterized phiE125 gp8 family phage protein
MISMQLISGPAAEPITLAELKAQCRVETSDEDAVLNSCIAAARAKAENMTGRALITQTWEQRLDAQDVPTSEIELLMPPVQSVSSVKYVDESGVLQTLPGGAYTLDASAFPGWLLPAFDTDWPAMRDQANAMQIRYVTGYGNSGSSVPPDLRAWLLMTAAFLFANREAMSVDGKVADVPNRFVDALLDPYRTWKA